MRPTAEFPRFIPACAGNARYAPCRPPPAPVHPRVCGERPCRPLQQARRSGSSPRVRGTLYDWEAGEQGDRFIPACAGNAAAIPTTRPRSSVHPRVCGERSSRAGTKRNMRGSSPRVRGTQAEEPRKESRIRFIPACAGNASQPPLILHDTPVHPRVCGERFVSLSDAAAAFGSSPRVRGTPFRTSSQLVAERFIPACAGNALSPAATGALPPVHPRVCGERAGSVYVSLFARGSSPRVRGTPYTSGCPQRSQRFIPACAGNAPLACWLSNLTSVHPRVCGERSRAFSNVPQPPGSSPRVRGTLTLLQAAPIQ